MKTKLLLFTNLFCFGVFAQTISEGFENVTNLPAAGWAQQNLSTPVGTNPNWDQGVTGNFPANSGAGFIGVGFNSVAGAATISNWLFTPNRTFSNGDIITFFTRTVDGPQYADRMQVRLSLNGASVNVGTTNTSVGDFTTLLLDVNPTLIATGTGSYPSVWTQFTITISGLATPTSGRAAFRYFVPNGGPSGSNSDYIGIDQFVYTPAGSAAPDVKPVSFIGQYKQIPYSQRSAMPLEGKIENIGTAVATDAKITVKIFQAPNFTTPLQTTSSTPASLNAGANSVFAAGSFSPTSVGVYRVEYVSSCTNNASALNDTLIYEFELTPKTYARDNGVSNLALGIGAGPVGNLGSIFTINAATPIDSVFFAIQKGGSVNTPGDGVGDSTRVHVYSVTNGLPNTLIGRSNNYIFTPADTLGLTQKTFAVRSLAGATLTLNPGQYYVGLTENQTNLGLAFSNVIFTTNTVYASWTGQAWAPVENFGSGFAKSPIIHPILASCEITATTSTSPSSCGASDGSATATPTTGAGPYNYLWSNGAIGQTANNLAAGTYTVTITDANSCKVTVTAIVSNPNAPNANIVSQTNVECNGLSSGMVTVSVSGGVAPYDIVWSTGAITSTISGLAAGVYVAYVTDDNGCTTSATATITEPAVLVSSVDSKSNISCFGLSDGEVIAAVTGGTPGYTYLWSTGAITQNITGVIAGVYTLDVTDANGCTSNLSVTLTEPTAISTTISSTISNGSDGTATVTATGGTTPYSYLWTPSGQITATATGLAGGNYSVTVTDNNGCTKTESVYVGSLGIKEINGNGVVKLYPNPTSDLLNVSLSFNETEDVKVKLVSASGQIIDNYVFNGKSVNVLSTERLVPGIYFLEIKSEFSEMLMMRFVKN
ncbi:MAG: choice-of-anchor J domain-containing protein [Bacteroidetes bacterium]|nr:choice-of-anchor J domain-containing protein [Bacteroidota bacterium]